MNTSDKEPMVHGQVVQNRLNHLNLVADDKTIERILARIPKDILNTVQQVKKGQWLPGTLFAIVNDCIAAEIGDEGCYNLSVKSFNKVVESSIVSPFFRSALNIFKINPKTLLKLLPLFWKSIYKNVGDMQIIEKGPTRIQILFNDLPLYLSGNRNHLMSIAGGINALFSLSGAKTLVIVEKFSKETGQATFIASWASNLMRNKKD